MANTIILKAVGPRSAGADCPVKIKLYVLIGHATNGECNLSDAVEGIPSYASAEPTLICQTAGEALILSKPVGPQWIVDTVKINRFLAVVIPIVIPKLSDCSRLMVIYELKSNVYKRHC